MKYNKPLFVFDIDETLVHTFDSKSGFQQAEKGSVYEIYSMDLDGDFYWGFIRPYARELLSYCNQIGYVGFWSAGQDDYVHSIVPILLQDTNVKPIFVLHRDYCKMMPDNYYNIKEYDVKKPLENLIHDTLTKIKTPTPIQFQDIVIFDDRDDVCSQNSSHHFFVKAFKPEKKQKEATDEELKYVINHIEKGLIKKKSILEIASTFNS